MSPAAVVPAATQVLPAGTAVVLLNLASGSEYEGKGAKVVLFDARQGKYLVDVEGTLCSFRRQNVAPRANPVQDPAASPAGPEAALPPGMGREAGPAEEEGEDAVGPEPRPTGERGEAGELQAEPQAAVPSGAEQLLGQEEEEEEEAEEEGGWSRGSGGPGGGACGSDDRAGGSQGGRLVAPSGGEALRWLLRHRFVAAGAPAPEALRALAARPRPPLDAGLLARFRAALVQAIRASGGSLLANSGMACLYQQDPSYRDIVHSLGGVRDVCQRLGLRLQGEHPCHVLALRDDEAPEDEPRPLPSEVGGEGGPAPEALRALAARPRPPFDAGLLARFRAALVQAIRASGGSLRANSGMACLYQQDPSYRDIVHSLGGVRDVCQRLGLRLQGEHPCHFLALRDDEAAEDGLPRPPSEAGGRGSAEGPPPPAEAVPAAGAGPPPGRRLDAALAGELRARLEEAQAGVHAAMADRQQCLQAADRQQLELLRAKEEELCRREQALQERERAVQEREEALLRRAAALDSSDSGLERREHTPILRPPDGETGWQQCYDADSGRYWWCHEGSGRFFFPGDGHIRVMPLS